MNKKHIIFIVMLTVLYIAIFVFSVLLKPLPSSTQDNQKEGIIRHEVMQCKQGEYIASSQWNIICRDGNNVTHGDNKLGSFKNLVADASFVLRGEYLFLVNGKELTLLHLSEKDNTKVITASLISEYITGLAALFTTESTVTLWYSIEKEKQKESDIGTDLIQLEINLTEKIIIPKRSLQLTETLKVNSLYPGEEGSILLLEQAYPFLEAAKQMLYIKDNENTPVVINIPCSDSSYIFPAFTQPLLFKEECHTQQKGWFSLHNSELIQLALGTEAKILMLLDITESGIYFLSDKGVAQYDLHSKEEHLLIPMPQEIPPSAIMHIVRKDSIIDSEYITFTADILVSPDTIYRLIINNYDWHDKKSIFP